MAYMVQELGSTHRRFNVKNIFSIAIAAISVAAMQPGLAQELTASNPPVRILTCKAVVTHATAFEGEQGQRSMRTGATVRIAFVNRSAQTATEVTFLVHDQPITFQGQFLKGKPVQHTFGPYDAVDDHDTCDVSAVKFDDGRMWQRL